MRRDERRVLMFLFAMVMGAVVGWAVYGALTNGGWGSQYATLGGVLAFFATMLIFYGLISVRLSS